MGKGDTPRPFSVSKEEFTVNWNRTFGKTISLDDVADFTWGYADEFFLETEKGNFLWSDPDYGGTNRITPYTGSYQHWCKHRANIPFGRDKGKHIIRDYCGPEVKLP